jgi:hypothetical protein
MKTYFFNARIHTERPTFSSGIIDIKNGSEAYSSILTLLAENLSVDKEQIEIITLNKV